jgi:hypothetical protein
MLLGCLLKHPILPGKRLELLREVVPDLRGLAILANVGWRGAMQEIAEVEVAARTLGVNAVDKLAIRRADPSSQRSRAGRKLCTMRRPTCGRQSGPHHRLGT